MHGLAQLFIDHRLGFIPKDFPEPPSVLTVPFISAKQGVVSNSTAASTIQRFFTPPP
jgi:hypothetical protein